MRVQCPNCSKVIPVTPKIAGRKAKCNCGTVLQIPQLSSPAPAGGATPQAIEIACTSCQRRLSVPVSAAGKKVKCPCGVATSVPHAGAAHVGAAPPVPPHTNDPFGMPVDDPFGMPADGDPFAASSDEFDENPYAAPSGSDQYGMTSAPAYMSAPKPRKKAKQKKKSASASSGPDMSQVLSGIGMMVGAVVWFFGALALGRIFFYPPILFIIGLFTMVKGFMKS